MTWKNLTLDENFQRIYAVSYSGGNADSKLVEIDYYGAVQNTIDIPGFKAIYLPKISLSENRIYFMGEETKDKDALRFYSVKTDGTDMRIQSKFNIRYGDSEDFVVLE
jgi:uncharacterized protein YjiK